jgi:hypothetical protein
MDTCRSQDEISVKLLPATPDEVLVAVTKSGDCSARRPEKRRALYRLKYLEELEALSGKRHEHSAASDELGK